MPHTSFPHFRSRLPALWWCLSTALLFAATLPVWRPDTDSLLPRIPLFGWGLFIPESLEWLLLAAAAIAVGGVAFSSRRPRGVATAVIVWLTASALLIVGDQLRFQPWWIHLAVAGVVLAWASPERVPLLWTLFLAGMYGWSAWSKWDYSFFVSHGRELVAALLHAVRLPVRLSPEALSRAAFLLPLGETIVAGLLLFRRTRRLALFAAIGMHVLLGLALGPTGWNHSRGVLAWNAVCIAQLFVLLALTKRSEAAESTAFAPGDKLAATVLGGVMVVPLLAPWGLCDPWLAWELYAARPARVEFSVAASERSSLPPEVRHFVEPEFPGRDWCRVRLDRWALEELSVPVAPGVRVPLALASAMCRRESWPAECRVDVVSPANRFHGKRTIVTLFSVDEIDAALGDFWLNVQPRPRDR